MSFGARAVIRLGALKHNFKLIRSAAPASKIMAVIKANAYGHGLLAVAKSLPDADAFAVARLSEANHLRDHGVEVPIVLLSGLRSKEEFQAAVNRDFLPVVHSPEQIELLASCKRGAVEVWLKFDTGMSRLGFAPHDAAELIQRIQGLTSVRRLGLMTHLASADDLESGATVKQLKQFQDVIADFDGAVSIANSAGILGWPEVCAMTPGAIGEKWIRPGIALFGISPFPDKTGKDFGLQPVMQFEAKLIAVKPLLQGARVGYGGDYRCESDIVMGVISVGYGDGYTRQFRSGTPVLINGRTVPVIGKISMDMVSVDLGSAAKDRPGDVATLWGDGLPVEEVARWANAIPYELVCGITNREASEIVD